MAAMHACKYTGKNTNGAEMQHRPPLKLLQSLKQPVSSAAGLSLKPCRWLSRSVRLVISTNADFEC